MRSEVKVLAHAQEFVFSLEGVKLPAPEAARSWLDEQFVAMDCEPLRASGKLLLADKVLVVAREAGVARLSDTQWGPVFAAAASVALGKPTIEIDVEAMTMNY